MKHLFQVYALAVDFVKVGDLNVNKKLLDLSSQVALGIKQSKSGTFLAKKASSIPSSTLQRLSLVNSILPTKMF
jgi:hypothetical protein